MDLGRRWRANWVTGIQSHPRCPGGVAPWLEMSGFRVSGEEGSGIVHIPPTIYLATFSIEILTSLLVFILVLTIPSSLFIIQVYFRRARPKLVESGYGISSFQVFAKQIDGRPTFL